MAKQRVITRVLKGGHSIPSETIERRYYRGMQNLVNLYMPICDGWSVYNNMQTSLLVCLGARNEILKVTETLIWEKILKTSKI
jgi:predicted ABC-type ATPase